MEDKRITLDCKPLSVNEAWKGRRFKTQAYKFYEMELLWVLPNIVLPPPPFEVRFEWGFKTKASDVDNPVKPFLDILCKKYGFNDKHVYKIVSEKRIVDKEYIKFEILHYGD